MQGYYAAAVTVEVAVVPSMQSAVAEMPVHIMGIAA